MYTKKECGACITSKELLKDYMHMIDVKSINDPEVATPVSMKGAPYFVQMSEGGSIREHTGFANKEILEGERFELEEKQG